MKSPAAFIIAILASAILSHAEEQGWTSLFNGKDLSGWKVPPGDNGHWRVVDGVIDYDARSEAPGPKDLWTEKSFSNFILKIDWRIKETSGLFVMPVILPDGSEKKDDSGKLVTVVKENADSGIYLRGFDKAQVNIWCWPIGSGELYGYRTDVSQPPEVAPARRHAPKFRPTNRWASGTALSLLCAATV